MNTPALGILMLVFSASAVGASVLALIVFRLRQRPIGPLTFGLTFGWGGWTLLYAGVLVATSLASAPRALSMNENKVFCGFYLDCHMQIAVVRIDRPPAIAHGNSVLTPFGAFYAITVRVSSSAARARLRLLSPTLVVHDGAGRTFTRSLAAEHALAAGGAPSTPLTTTLDPEGEFLATVVFDVAVDAHDLTLEVTDGFAIDRAIESILIGDEDSVLHKRTVFRLPS